MPALSRKAVTLLWLLVRLGMNNVGANRGDSECEAVISGPLNNDGEAPGPWLTANETHPVRVICQATCLDRLGAYSPDISLIVADQEQFTPVCLYGAHDSFYSWDGLYFEVHAGNISDCEAQNNYTMEYEYLITSNSSKIDHSVVICGVNTFHDLPPYLQHICWGQSYGIIRYNKITPSIDCKITNTLPMVISTIHTEVFGPSAAVVGSPLVSKLPQSTPISTYIIVIIILFVITLLLTVGLLRLRYQLISVQTVEQKLVINVEQPVASESATVREKETSFSEKSDSNRSSAQMQAQLQEKLPDTIGSRSKSL